MAGPGCPAVRLPRFLSQVEPQLLASCPPRSLGPWECSGSSFSSLDGPGTSPARPQPSVRFLKGKDEIFPKATQILTGKWTECPLLVLRGKKSVSIYRPLG